MVGTVKNGMESDSLEIDLYELIAMLKKRLLWLLVAALIGLAIFGGVSYFLITPQYTSTAMMYILSKETTVTSLADLQIGSQLTQDYKVMVNSRPVLEKVIEELALGINYKDLRDKLSIENPTDTRILFLTVKDENPDQAKQIVDCIARNASEYIGNIMEMLPPKIIETGEVSWEKSSPNVKLNAILGALLGMALVIGVSMIQVVCDDRIRTKEDVEKYLGIAVLADIAEYGEWKNMDRSGGKA